MVSYKYKLNKKDKNDKKDKYKEKDLNLMTTYQLKDICNREKLVKSIVNPLDKEELIRLIMKYRGESDTLFICNYAQDGIDRIEGFLKKSSKNILERIDIEYPAKIILYEGISLDILDDYRFLSNSDIAEGNALLVDNEFNVYTIFNIKKVFIDNEYRYFLTRSANVPIRESESRHCKLLLFSDKYSELIYDIYQGEEMLTGMAINCYSLDILQFEIRKIEETSIPLAIDFGTSNTTAGIYVNKESFTKDIYNIGEIEGEKLKFVKILDETKEETKFTPLIPSIVGVKNIIGDKIEYIFGYEAIMQSKKRYTDDGLTIFYDIKRWISDFEKKEKAIDINEKVVLIKRKDIIKAYLEYIISLASQRFKYKFKNICISCPSKQKYKFHELFKEILSDYSVDSENILEESAAVLYNTISELIERKKYVDGEKYKALIIDCGGGTTDLTGCSFSISNNRISYSLNIETAYENGDTDFGGNNLTFRILQFIKILLVQELSNKSNYIREAILGEFRVDIFRFVDKYGVNELFESLDEEYQRAEEILPTKFKLYETRGKEDYCKVKSNYYCLFNLAEEVKKVFFSNPELLKVTLSTNKISDNNNIFINYDKWKISSFDNGILKQVSMIPDIDVNTYEIATIIKGDVYSIINKFLEKLYINDELYDYSLIKLTGQSCKVEIFKEALKEFIPGKIIQLNNSKKNGMDEYDLKLSCLKGSLKYLYDKNFGYAEIKLSSKAPIFPYKITAYTHTGEMKTLIKGKEINQGFISRFVDRVTLKLYLMNTENKIKYEYDYDFEDSHMEKIDAETITNTYGNIPQEETDNIENNEIKFFAWSKEEYWGFYVVPILRKNEELYLGNDKFFYFENDQWEQNFFDGMK